MISLLLTCNDHLFVSVKHGNHAAHWVFPDVHGLPEVPWPLNWRGVQGFQVEQEDLVVHLVSEALDASGDQQVGLVELYRAETGKNAYLLLLGFSMFRNPN